MTRLCRRRRAPSITVSGATETSGERVKTPVNDDGHRRGTTENTPIAERGAANQILFVSRAIYFSITIKIGDSNKVLVILRR